MIGVMSAGINLAVAREFFELFKTPWEEYRSEERYDVVLCVADQQISVAGVAAKLMIVYAGRQAKVPRAHGSDSAAPRASGILSYNGKQLPIYGSIINPRDGRDCFLTDAQSGQSVGVRDQQGAQRIVYIGYDLFAEVELLLSKGQPPEYAEFPSVELHIAILRDRIVEFGMPLLEIPPIPEGYAFIACLTHDIDHPSLRLHRWDHTAWGFVFRALIGSVINLVRGRMSVAQLLTNWMAAATLPFVYLGLARDPWSGFDRYLEVERDIPSTFFVLPFKGLPGQTEAGMAPKIRASRYGAADIADRLRAIVQRGGEIGLHGIDAWIDSSKGGDEQAEIAKLVRGGCRGVRMHWLYFRDDSPEALEKAGFVYDSTVGYNQTIGYRAGTTQVYKPLQVQRLLELPLHVMDTALFYPRYLNYTKSEAMKRVIEMVDVACQFGGVMTINWHDRSIAPERLWGECYRDVLVVLQQTGAWCTSAGRTVSWFQNRRAVTFKRSEHGIEILQAKREGTSSQNLPGLKAYIHNSVEPCGHVTADHMEIPIECDEKVVISTTGVLQQDHSFRIHSSKQFIC